MGLDNRKEIRSFGYIAILCLFLCQCESLSNQKSGVSFKGLEPDSQPLRLKDQQFAFVGSAGIKVIPKNRDSENEVVEENTSHKKTDEKNGHSLAKREEKVPEKKKSELSVPPPPSKYEPVYSSGNCPKNLTPGETYCNIFPEGCLYVPTVVMSRPLFYIRGLIQGAPYSPPESTKSLFDSDGGYNLASAAKANNQMILATHSSNTILSSKTLGCLKHMSVDNKIDVASHSAGYQGLSNSSTVLSGSVANLQLLDCFYNTETVLSAVKNIHAGSCSGFYTPHRTKSGQWIPDNASYVSSHSSCDLEGSTGHIANVTPFLKRNFGSGAYVGGPNTSRKHKPGES